MAEHFRLLAKNEKGRLAFDDPAHLQGVLAALPARVSVTLERIRQIRSSQANRYYWSCVVPVVAEVLSIGRDLPLSRDQVHELLKKAFIGIEQTPIGEVAKSSAALSTDEFSAYVEAIQAHFGSEMGVAFPHPGEGLSA